MNKSNTSVKYPSARGFTLLEIMIAILIMAIGLAAMANLQGKLTRYSTMAKQRTIAMNLVEQQIETMRSFYTMEDTAVAACSTEQVGFDDLETCVAGTTVSVGNMQFNLSWTVVAYSQNDDGTTVAYTTASERYRPDLKLVTINADWVDGQGETQSVELVDIVDATSVFNTGRVSAKVDSNTPPRVTFDAGDFPGVVEIKIGSNKFKGSTTPKPRIIKKGQNVVTTFDVITVLNSSGEYLQRREEFKVVNCVCTLKNDELSKGLTPALWDGTFYPPGDNVNKPTGIVAVSTSGQPYECEMCCNDHHDTDATFMNEDGDTVNYDRYDPFRIELAGVGFFGDHPHYRNVNGEYVLANDGEDYMEACRFIRKDGFFIGTTDMSQQNLDVTEKSIFADPLVITAGDLLKGDRYTSSVKAFIEYFAQNVNVSTYPGDLPFFYDDPRLDNGVVDETWLIELNSAKAEESAMSRGIYIDYISSSLLKKIKCLYENDLSGQYAAFCDINKDPPYLEILPFYEMDVTSLATWKAGSTAVKVTQDSIIYIESPNFSRGLVSIADQDNVDSYVSASIEHSNTGLTDTNPIDPGDAWQSTEALDVNIGVGGAPRANGVLVGGKIISATNQINVETIRVQQSSPEGNCGITTILVNNKPQKHYICDLYAKSAETTDTGLSKVTGPVTVTISDYNWIKVIQDPVTHVKTEETLNRKVCFNSDYFAASYLPSIQNDGTVGYLGDPDIPLDPFPGEYTVFTFSNIIEDGLDTTNYDIFLDITIVDELASCP